jgi:hypothetical protein
MEHLSKAGVYNTSPKSALQRLRTSGTTPTMGTPINSNRLMSRTMLKWIERFAAEHLK